MNRIHMLEKSPKDNNIGIEWMPIIKIWIRVYNFPCSLFGSDALRICKYSHKIHWITKLAPFLP